jgi:hypothetical protein
VFCCVCRLTFRTQVVALSTYKVGEVTSVKWFTFRQKVGGEDHGGAGSPVGWWYLLGIVGSIFQE